MRKPRTIFDKQNKPAESKNGEIEACKAAILAALLDLRALSLDPECNEELLSSSLSEIEKEVSLLKQSFMLSGHATSSDSAEEDYSAYTPDGRKKLILCVERKQFFDSQSEAHRETGVNSGGIGLALRGINRTAGGYHWMYIDPDIINGGHHV